MNSSVLRFFVEARRGEMIAHVGKTGAGRNADHPRARSEQTGFADAECAPGGQHAACAVIGRIGEVDIRIVDDAVADGAVKPQGGVALILRVRDLLLCVGDHGGRVAVDEAAGAQKLRYVDFVHLEIFSGRLVARS